MDDRITGARTLALAAVTALGLATGACSSVPDWANPVEWYDSMFGRKGPAPAAATAANKPPSQGDAAKGSPNLATVPERPQPTPPANLKAAQDGLAADRANAKYIDDVVRNRVSETSPLAFDGATGSLDRTSQATLRRIADRQKAAGGGVRIVGFEPAAPLASGAKAPPAPASLVRAQMVAAELVRLGVNPQSIKIEGSAAREQAGRQAEIFLEN
jgi:outer membrane protein OmpA-like peptidoglycan-associated protein